VDSFGGIEAAIIEATGRLAPEFTLPPLRPLIGPPLGRMLEIALPDASDGLREDLAAAFRELYDGGLCCACDLYPGVANHLELWHGDGTLPAYLVTNKRLNPTLLLLRHFGIDGNFRRVVATDGSVGSPSKAENLRLLVEELGLAAADCLFVGDSADDHAAAEAIGMPFVAASYGYGDAAARAPHAVIRNFGELEPYLTAG